MRWITRPVFLRKIWRWKFDTLFAWALFERPHGIAMAADNSRAYVTDQGAHVVRILTFASNIVSTIAGSAYASGSKRTRISG